MKRYLTITEDDLQAIATAALEAVHQSEKWKEPITKVFECSISCVTMKNGGLPQYIPSVAFKRYLRRKLEDRGVNVVKNELGVSA